MMFMYITLEEVLLLVSVIIAVINAAVNIYRKK